MTTYAKGGSGDIWNFSGNVTVGGIIAYGTGIIGDGSISVANDITTTTGVFIENTIYTPKETVVSFPINAETVAAHLWIAPDAYTVTKIEEIHAVKSDSGLPAVIMVTKTTGTEAPGSGKALIADAYLYLTNDANVLQSPALTTDVNLVAGDRLSIYTNRTPTALAGGIITVTLQRS